MASSGSSVSLPRIASAKRPNSNVVASSTVEQTAPHSKSVLAAQPVSDTFSSITLDEAIGDRKNDGSSIFQFVLEKPPCEQVYIRAAEVFTFIRDNYLSENPLIIEALLDSVHPYLCTHKDTDTLLSLRLLKLKFQTVLMQLWDHFIEKNYFNLTGTLATNWRNIISSVSAIITNMTFRSYECAKDMIEIQFFQKLLSSIDDKSISVQNCRTLAKITILENILVCQYNCIRWCLEEAKPIFRQNGGMEKMLSLRKFMKDKEKFRRAAINALLCIAYTLEESEGDLIDEETKAKLTSFVCSQACKAVQMPNRMVDNMSLMEYIDTINVLLASDVRKFQLCADSSLFDCIAAAIDTNDDETELITVVRCLYLITFIDEGKKRVKENQQLLEAVERLKSDANESVRKNAEGTLWNISGQRPVEIAASYTVETAKTSQQHVMISYDWHHQHIAAAINLQLKSLGYFTWIDIDRMSGSTLEAMATAVEQSAVIVVCFSERYKNSPNCRKEAEYADSLGKPIVPVRTDPNYKADGWLGLMLGTKLYFKCESLENVESIIPKLTSELGNRGTLGQIQIAEDKHHASGTSNMDKIAEMSKEELKINFDRLGWDWLVEDLSGFEFAFLYQIYQRSMEGFLQTLKEDFGLKERKIRFQFADYVVKMSKLIETT